MQGAEFRSGIRYKVLIGRNTCLRKSGEVRDTCLPQAGEIRDFRQCRMLNPD